MNWPFKRSVKPSKFLKNISNQDITTMKGYLTGWWRCLDNPHSSLPSTACAVASRTILTKVSISGLKGLASWVCLDDSGKAAGARLVRG
jgi:hypothetical protein